MASLPTGTVTFLFTDIEGSTRLLQELGDRYTDILEEHRRLLRAAFRERGGEEVDNQGDAFFFAFQRAKDAVAAAVAAQRAIRRAPWPEGVTIRVRMGVHTGEPIRAGAGYVGMDVHRAARICGAGHGRQILLSDSTGALVAGDPPDGVALRDLGVHRLKDLTQGQRMFQVVAADLPDHFPPLKALDVLPNNLPVQLTGFIGRELEKPEVKRLLGTARILTLTGSGGAGKTRLALQVAAELLDQYSDGVWLVELAALSDPSLVPTAVATVLNVQEPRGSQLPIIEILVDFLRSKSLLLVVDNCEHLLPACAGLSDRLLRSCPALRMLATSREALHIPGEIIWRVPSLSFPDLGILPSLEQLSEYEAVRLFVDRAVSHEPGFVMSNDTVRPVVQVCQRLDGIPLAIELAAARVRVLSVEQIANRLDDRFRLLTGGGWMVLPRHQTLLATMDWSYDLLSRGNGLYCGGCQSLRGDARWRRSRRSAPGTGLRRLMC
jgi:class 3 adenylate cyclase